MTEHDALHQIEQNGGDREQEVRSAAPEDEQRVVGENADVPAGEGEEADESGVEGGDQDGATAHGEDADDATGSHESDGGEDDRSELVKEIEDDPSSNPDDELLKDIKGG